MPNTDETNLTDLGYLDDSVEGSREIFARVADIEVHVIGTDTDELGDIETVFERQFEKVVEAYVKHRDNGDIY